MRNRNWIALAGVALLAVACASKPPPGPPPGFGDEADGDGDGPRRPREQLFISPAGEPFRAPPGQPYPVAAWFAQADADHDGKLTREEFRADAERWFKVLDKDGDGQVRMPEATRWEEELVPEITRSGLGMRGAGPGDRPGAGRNVLDTRLQGAAAFSLINEPHPIRGADSDYSFGVTPAEWRAASDRRFTVLDTDGDGVLLLAALRPTPAQLIAGQREGRPEGGPKGRPPGPPPRGGSAPRR